MRQVLPEIRRIGLVVIVTASIYLVCARLNDWLFAGLTATFSNSIKLSWLYLPSGLRLVFVLIFGSWGAVGISAGTFLLLMPHGGHGDLPTALMGAFLSGFAPWVAMVISRRKYALDESLRNFDSATLLKMSLIFSIVSPLMHQVWFIAYHRNEDIIDSTMMMIAGDWLGTIAILYAGKLLLKLFEMRSAAGNLRL